MFCFICEDVQVPTLTSLVIHYKVIHLLGPYSTYSCKENNCSQSFQTLSSFKKHVLNKHINSFENNEVTQCNNKNNSQLNYDVHMHDIDVANNTFDEIPQIPSEKLFDFNESIQQFHLLAVQFCLNLHNNNNFCRSDVLNIKDNIEVKLIKPIVSLLKNIIKNEIKDPLILSKFCTVISAISDPFKFCQTEHSLNNWLATNDFISDKFQQFTINNEVHLINHNGEIIYDELSTKGILMPLKFQIQKYFEQNNNLDLALKRYNNLMNYSVSDENVTLSNFVQGSLWKEKILPFQNKLVLPFFMYIDDFEINNPLGSKSMCHSISAVYYSFPLNEHNSKLTHIFLAALIKSKDLKTFGNDL